MELNKLTRFRSSNMTEPLLIVYNTQMNSFKIVYTICAWLWCMTPVMTYQPPREEKQNTERRGSNSQQDVSLDKLPVPGNGMIVVTPDLKRALDALGAGSVVLSAERYKELMARVESSKSETQSQEILFSKCSIAGEVTNKNGREIAELTFELEFRTETRNAVVSLPFKGLRLSAASLNGAPPLWGPDPDNWTIVVKEPQVCQLKIATSVTISRVGQEKRFVLERVPASAITSLNLKVSGAVSQAVVAGYGNIQITAIPEGSSLLQAPALGVLSRLELAWQPSVQSNTAHAQLIEGDVRILVEDTSATVEARMKPVPFVPFQLPWKVRLPANAQNVRAELLRDEGMNSEPLLVTAQKDGIYQITSAYPLVTTGFLQLLLRWKQPLPEHEAADANLLGACEVIEPAGRQQTGTLLLQLPDDSVALFKPRQLNMLERGFSERESRRQQKYRYEQQPAGFEVFPVTRRPSRGIVEARIRHVVTAQPQAWLLNTEIELTGNNRTQLQHLDFTWPADWKLNRRILFSPVVKDIEQDEKSNKVRLILDTRQASPIVIKLEGQSNSNADHNTFPLPSIVSAACLLQEKLVPAEIVIQKEQLKLDAVNADLRLTQVDKSFQEEMEDGIFSQKQFRVLRHPATLTLTRTLRLPQYTSHAVVYVGDKECITRQTIQFTGNAELPRQFQVWLPRIARSAQWVQQFADGRQSVPLAVKTLPDDDDGALQRLLLEVPSSNNSSPVTLVVTLDTSAAHPITVPLIRIDPSQASLQNNVSIKTACDNGIAVTLPPDLPGWSVQNDGVADSIAGDSLTPLLVLEKKTISTMEKSVPVQRMSTTVLNRSGTWLMETSFEIGPVAQTPLSMTIPVPASQLRLYGWKLNGEAMPSNQLKLVSTDHHCKVIVQLPVSALRNQVQVSISCEIEKPASLFLWRIPAFSCLSDHQHHLVPHDWTIQADNSSWLWASNATVTNWYQATQGWKPYTAQSLSSREQLHGYQLSSLAVKPTVWILTFPRLFSMAFISIAVLVVFHFMIRQTLWKQRCLLLGMILLCCIYVIMPGLALAILWSSMPGLLAWLALVVWNSWASWKNRVPRVFQSTEQLTVIKPRNPTAARMPISGYDAPTVLASKPPAIP